MTPVEVVDTMMRHDKFSQWLGIEVLQVHDGYSRIRMTVREEMVNGFNIAHGGIAFSLADSAFAFACNSDGNITVALDVSTSFPKPAKPGDVLTAEAKQINSTKKTGLYMVEVRNQNNELVCLSKGTCFKTDRRLVEDHI